jgi:hypothetical protein
LRNVPNSLLLITRVNDFAGETFENDEDSQLDQVLRQRISDQKYSEQIKVFEKAFAIDRLDQYEKKIMTVRKVRFVFFFKLCLGRVCTKRRIVPFWIK